MLPNFLLKQPGDLNALSFQWDRAGQGGKNIRTKNIEGRNKYAGSILLSVIFP